MSELALLSRNMRAARHFARGLSDTSHPLLVHIIPIRRCNIDCGYCNEYDKISQPVPTDAMLARIDHLARLGTSVTSFSGGEPLLHPDLDRLIGRIRSHGMMAGLITNGYLLSPKRIEALNRAGLDYLQISIDNVEPDEISKKSLRLLDKKLQLAARLRGLRRQHQLGARRRHQDAGRRAHDHAPRARAWVSPRRSGSSTTAAAG